MSGQRAGQRAIVEKTPTLPATTGPFKKSRPPTTTHGPGVWTTLQRSIGNAAVARLISAQRTARTESSTPVSKGTQQQIDAERSGGHPLDRQTRSEMEPILGTQLSDVRLHRGTSVTRLARDLDATAFTQGRDVFLGDGAGRETLVHELTHAAQARTGASAVEREPSGPIRERMIDRSDAGERNRTVATIEIVGHASPRWRGARTPEIADQNNWRLAEQRAEMTRMEVETLLTQLLPDRELLFVYRFKRASEVGREKPVEALAEAADVTLEVEGRGSGETLAEAGQRGRRANDDPMRRVDVKVTLHAQTETDVEETIERTERKPGATRDWSIWVTGEAGAEAIGKAGAILIQLRNNKTKVVGTYGGWFGGAGASVGFNFAKTSRPDFESFKTPEPMSFADFSGANFSIASVGFGVAIFGLEWSKFRFDRFPGGQKTPGGIQVGGLSFGGIELNLGSAVYGAMFLADDPREDYDETTRIKRVQTFDSLSQENSSHRVLFITGSPNVTAWQSDLLHEYLYAIVVRSGL